MSIFGATATPVLELLSCYSRKRTLKSGPERILILPYLFFVCGVALLNVNNVSIFFPTNNKVWDKVMMFLHVFVILSLEMSVFQHALECGQGCVWMRDVHGSVDSVWTGVVWTGGHVEGWDVCVDRGCTPFHSAYTLSLKDDH